MFLAALLKVCITADRVQIKHDVGGRSIKGVIGRPSASKQAGLDQVSSLISGLKVCIAG